MTSQEIHNHILAIQSQIASDIKCNHKPVEDLDEWESYSEQIDLNFSTENNQVVCYAYPVINGSTDTNPDHAVKIPIHTLVICPVCDGTTISKYSPTKCQRCNATGKITKEIADRLQRISQHLSQKLFGIN
jgi:hypothetical protein